MVAAAHPAFILMDCLGLLFGGLHPLLVHLPIGFLLLFAALEFGSWLAPWRSGLNLPAPPANDSVDSGLEK
jgi:hypothetical protein